MTGEGNRIFQWACRNIGGFWRAQRAHDPVADFFFKTVCNGKRDDEHQRAQKQSAGGNIGDKRNAAVLFAAKVAKPDEEIEWS